MASQLQLRRGTTAQHAVFTGAPAEVTVDTDKKTVVVHDGSTPGGFPVEGLAGKPAGGSLAGTYPNPSLASITSTGTTVARTIQNRFAESVNILDYGADPTGVNDSWLAIQRAIYSATFTAGDPNNNAAVLTISDVQTVSGIPNIPTLFTRQGVREVHIPEGFFKITRPLIVNHGTNIIGIGAPDKCFVFTETQTFNALETGSFWAARERGVDYPAQVNAALTEEYNANLAIKNIQFRGITPSFFPGIVANTTRSGATATANVPNHGFINGEEIYVFAGEPFGFGLRTINVVNQNTFTYAVSNSGLTSTFASYRGVGADREGYPKDWYIWPLNNTAVVSSQALASSITITVNRRIAMYIGSSIKFSGGSDNYRIASYTRTSNSTTFTLTAGLQRTVQAGELLQIGFAKHNGIMIFGGENTTVERCYTQNFLGAGMFILGGSPSPVINNCMSTSNHIGYWLEGAYPQTLLKPSGDANDVFLRAGYLRAFSPTTVINMKHEDFGGYPSTSLFEIGCDESGVQSGLIVIGGTSNSGNYTYSSTSPRADRSMIVTQEFGTSPGINFVGFTGNSYGLYTITRYARQTGVISRQLGRVAPTDDNNTMNLVSTLRQDSKSPEIWPDNDYNIRMHGYFDSNLNATGAGIYLDQQSKIEHDASFVRQGTELTVTTPTPHLLAAGDYVALLNSYNQSPWISFSNDNGVTVYFQGTFKVLTVPSPTTLTIQVNDAGPANGATIPCSVYLLKYTIFHSIRNGRHIFQMPDNTIALATKSMVQFLAKDRTQLAGLVVPTKNTGQWWTKDQLTLGGDPDSPASRILTGTGAPSATAPDGSIYLRTDGAADTTLYVRAGGSWTALTST